jgi:RNA polymerase sigma-70 factor (ECF subfamily)
MSGLEEGGCSSRKEQTRHTLLRRAQDPDDHAAWDEFVLQYRRFIYHVLNRMSVPVDEADDLCQEVLLRIWQRLGSYDRTRGGFRGWLSFVIRNTVLNQISSAQRRSAWHDQFQELQINRPANDALDEMIQNEWKAYVSNRALENLKTHFSTNAVEVFSMTLKGAEAPEIADKLKLKVQTVYSLRTRVKAQFMAEIRGLIEELEL